MWTYERKLFGAIQMKETVRTTHIGGRSHIEDFAAIALYRWTIHMTVLEAVIFVASDVGRRKQVEAYFYSKHWN